MAKALYSPRHRRLLQMLLDRRRAAGLTQAEVALKLHRHQPFIANIENGERRLDLLEFLDLAEAVGFDPGEFLVELVRTG